MNWILKLFRFIRRLSQQTPALRKSFFIHCAIKFSYSTFISSCTDGPKSVRNVRTKFLLSGKFDKIWLTLHGWIMKKGRKRIGCSAWVMIFRISSRRVWDSNSSTKILETSSSEINDPSKVNSRSRRRVTIKFLMIFTQVQRAEIQNWNLIARMEENVIFYGNWIFI